MRMAITKSDTYSGIADSSSWGMKTEAAFNINSLERLFFNMA